MKLITVKFGGSCLGAPVEATKHFGQARHIVQHYLAAGTTPVIVVSALAGETRRLKRMADDLFTRGPDQDFLLAQGEFFASQTVARYLSAQGLPAQALWGEKLPVFASDDYGCAEITGVDTAAITRLMAQGIVPVIPGFLGQTPAGNVATLGFDGSDTSAVAVAAALGTDCVLYKDVAGIYTAHPGRVAAAKIIPEIGYDDMLAYARAGSQVMHPRAVQTAAASGTVVRVTAFGDPLAAGSRVTGAAPALPVVGLSHQMQDGQALITVIGRDLDRFTSEQQVLSQSVTPGDHQGHTMTFRLQANAALDTALSGLHRGFGLDAS